MANKKKVNVSELARKNGISPNVVYNRLHSGWSLEKALNTPVRKRKSRPRKKPVAPLVTPATAPTQPPAQQVNRLCKPCMAVSITGCIIVVLLAYWYMNM